MITTRIKVTFKKTGWCKNDDEQSDFKTEFTVNTYLEVKDK